MNPDPAQLARKIEPRWDEVRHRRVLQSIQRARQPKPRQAWRGWLVTGGMVAAAAAALLIWLVPSALVTDHGVTSVQATRPAAPANASAVRLGNGVFATLFADAEVSITERTPERTAVSQSRGSVRYSVDPDEHIWFQVQVQGVTVRVLGTVFDVAAEGRLVKVSVDRGRVQVDHLGGVSILHAGQNGEFYGIEDGETASVDAAAEEEVEQEAVARTSKPAVGSKRRTESRDVKEAPPLSARELLRRADQERAKGNDTEAAAQLRELLRLYPKDGQVIAARFTLGRIETALGRYLSAASEFAQARAAAPAGPLAEDALAEEAWNRHLGGQDAQAQALAREYLDRYSSGPHRSRMNRLLSAD